jgi:hypothetical protein
MRSISKFLLYLGMREVQRLQMTGGLPEGTKIITSHRGLGRPPKERPEPPPAIGIGPKPYEDEGDF